MDEFGEGQLASDVNMGTETQPNDIYTRQVQRAKEEARRTFNIGPGRTPLEIRPVAGGANSTNGDGEQEREEELARRFFLPGGRINKEKLTIEYGSQNVGTIIVDELDGALYDLQEQNQLDRTFDIAMGNQVAEMRIVRQKLEKIARLPEKTPKNIKQATGIDLRPEDILELGDISERARLLEKWEQVLRSTKVIVEWYNRPQRMLQGNIDKYTELIGSTEMPRNEAYYNLFTAPEIIPGTPQFGEILDVAMQEWVGTLTMNPVVEFYLKKEDGLREELVWWQKQPDSQQKMTRTNAISQKLNGSLIPKSVRDEFDDLPQFATTAQQETWDNQQREKWDSGRRNIFAEAPSRSYREGMIQYISSELYRRYPNLNQDDLFHRRIAESAARLGLLLTMHWDLPAKYCLSLSDKSDPERGIYKWSLETTWNDLLKAVNWPTRAGNEEDSYNAPFGNSRFTRYMFAPASHYMENVGFTVVGRDHKTGKRVEKNVSMLDMVKTFGMNFRDIPWLEVNLVLTDGRNVDSRQRVRLLEVKRKLDAGLRAREISDGKVVVQKGGPVELDIDWQAVTDSRDDSNDIVNRLILLYTVGKYYAVATRTDYIKLLGDAVTEAFWRGLNKPGDVGMGIYLGNTGLERETIDKLKILFRQNLAAAILDATLGRTQISKEEYDNARLSSVASDQTVVNMLEKVRFLSKNDADKIVAIRSKKEGAIPGEKNVPYFEPWEIKDIERSGVYRPFSIIEGSGRFIKKKRQDN